MTLRGLVLWAIRLFVLFVLVSIAWTLLYRVVPPPVTFTQIGDMAAGHGLTRKWMSIDEIDRDMVRAAIAAEDSKFCSHHGFDQDAIAAAMRRNAQGGGVIRGGSTISQQTAKNAFLWQGGGYFRKGLEAWFTMLIENLWGKRRIMEVYLNIAETGIGTYGVNAGAERYFGHDASNMTRTEAARIAAVLPLPKERGAIAPRGFTRRYGNSIAARIAIVARDGLDTCVYRDADSPKAAEESEAPTRRSPVPKKEKAAPEPPPEPVEALPATPLPGEDYELPETAPPAPAEPAPAFPPPPGPAPDLNAI